MKIECERILDTFRAVRCCEWCCLSPGRGVQCEPHHFRCKGNGGGFRLDVSINLLAVCRVCHSKAHAGEIPRMAILGVIASRYGADPDDVEEAIHVLVRLKKEWDRADIAKNLKPLSQPVRWLVERSLNETMPDEHREELEGVFGQ